MTVDERIAARLGELGWSQKELAARAGVHVSYIGHLLRGRAVSPKLLRKVAEVMELDADLLVVESGLRVRPESLRHKQAMLLAQKRGWSIGAGGELMS